MGKLEKPVSKGRRRFLKTIGALGGATIFSRLVPWRQYDETFSYQSSDSPDEFTTDTLKFMTWNIAAWRKRSLNADEASGFFPFRSDISEHLVAGLRKIIDSAPDILATQEDTTGCMANYYLNSVAFLAGIFGNAFYTPFFNHDFYFGLQHGGDYGQATYSKISLQDQQQYIFFKDMSVDLGTVLQHYLVGTKGVNTTSFFWKGKKIFVDNLHLSSKNEDEERSQQIDLYFEKVFDPGTTRIIAGDFNFPFDKNELKEYEDGTDHTDDEAPYYLADKIKKIGLDKFVLPPGLEIRDGMFSHSFGNETYPATNPDTLESTVCDRMYDTILIYSPKHNLSFDNYTVHQRVPSDHAAVVADLRIKDV